MREIKFRMWTGSTMLYDLGNTMECLKQQRAHDLGYKLGDHLGCIPYDHVGVGSAFMQFTGQKDKDGNDIYEGDVLCMDGRYKYGVRFEDAKFVCYHIEGNGFGKWGDLHRFFDPDFADFHVVVIGHIYQEQYKELV